MLTVAASILRDPVDPRDWRIAGAPLASGADGVDPWRTPISMQVGPECVQNAVADACEMALPGDVVQLSRRFLVHETMRQMGTLGAPFRGSHVRAAISALRRVGIPRESLWPHERSWDVQPGVLAYGDAETRMAWEFRRCSGAEDVDRALAAGLPVVMSFAWDKSHARPAPDAVLEPVVHADAGHAWVICRREGDAYRARNSHGEQYGDRGTIRVSRAFVDAAWDAWAIRWVG